jgi:hypothetical protein
MMKQLNTSMAAKQIPQVDAFAPLKKRRYFTLIIKIFHSILFSQAFAQQALMANESKERMLSSRRVICLDKEFSL